MVGNVKMYSLLAQLAIIQLGLGCGKTNFKSGAHVKEADASTSATASSQVDVVSAAGVSEVTLKCDPSAPIPEIHYKEGSPPKIKLNGEVCTSGSGQVMSLLFLIDISLSMNQKLSYDVPAPEVFNGDVDRGDPPSGDNIKPAPDASKMPTISYDLGTDPIVKGTCGRHQALTAVISELQERGAYDEIDVQVILFDDDDHALKPITLPGKGRKASIGKHYPVAEVCAGKGDTNYSPVFTAASAHLRASRPGAKAVYFISDGNPSQGKVAMSIHAGKLLRDSNPDMAFVSVLLGKDTGPAFATMAAIAGEAKYVRTVAAASSLLEQLTSFRIAMFAREGLHLQLDADATGVAITDLQQVKGAWTWQSEPFTPKFTTTKATASQVQLTLKAKDEAGMEHTQVIELKLIKD